MNIYFQFDDEEKLEKFLKKVEDAIIDIQIFTYETPHPPFKGLLMESVGEDMLIITSIIYHHYNSEGKDCWRYKFFYVDLHHPKVGVELLKLLT